MKYTESKNTIIIEFEESDNDIEKRFMHSSVRLAFQTLQLRELK